MTTEELKEWLANEEWHNSEDAELIAAFKDCRAQLAAAVQRAEAAERENAALREERQALVIAAADRKATFLRLREENERLRAALRKR